MTKEEEETERRFGNDLRNAAIKGNLEEVKRFIRGGVNYKIRDKLVRFKD